MQIWGPHSLLTPSTELWAIGRIIDLFKPQTSSPPQATMQPERKMLQKWCCPLVMPVAKRSEQVGFSLRDPRIEIFDGLPTDLCMDQSASF